MQKGFSLILLLIMVISTIPIGYGDVATYTLTYDGNTNTSGTAPISVDVDEGTSTTLAGAGDLDKIGYQFIGWNTLPDGTGTSYEAGASLTMPGENITLYARWSETYTVTYDGNGQTGGAIPTDANNYIEGATVTTKYADSLVKTGKTLIGWNTATDGSGTNYPRGSALIMPGANLTLYAQWRDPFVLANSAIRFGTGTETSVNANGSLLQPFYYDSVLGGGNWYPLTFGNYPLNYAIGISGDGANVWNAAGIIAVDQALTNYALDLSGYTPTASDKGYGTIIVKGRLTIDSKELDIERAYTLEENSRFISMKTKVTNVSGSDIENVRIWFGTQDDYVGNEDDPTKKRGNLVSGAFEVLLDKNNQASALEVSSGATGVLFYSPHATADTIIGSGLSMNIVTSTDPRTTGPTITSDNSYGIFVRVSDLANGESDEASVYYAAGELASLGDLASDLSDTASPVPGKPTSVTATAGNTQASVSFAAPTSIGDSAITGYTVTSTPGNVVATGTSSPIAITGLTNGTAYTFTVFATNGQGNGSLSDASNEVTPIAPTPTPSPEPDPEPTTTPPPKPVGVTIIVNGKEQSSGTVEIKENNDGTKDAAIDIDEETVNNRIDAIVAEATSNNRNLLEVPVTIKDADKLSVSLDGNIVDKLANNKFDMSIKSSGIEYKIPSEQLQIEKIMKEFDVNGETSDIVITFKINQVLTEKVNIIKTSATEKGFALVVPPVEFSIEVTSKSNPDQKVFINTFSQFVTRTIQIPEGVDPTQITTGIVYNEDGTFSHIPTVLFEVDGVYYAKLNSLTNSEYSVIWNPIQVNAVKGQWSEKYVNNMASRLVIQDPGNFDPKANITRGDYVEYLIKGAGLFRTGVAKDGIFTDVIGSGDQQDAIAVAVERGIISGYEDGTFKSSDLITREEAMTMSSSLLQYIIINHEELGKINTYEDSELVSDWAYDAVSNVLNRNVFNGRSASEIAPQSYLTYAEAATSIYNMLIQAEMISE
jgi:Listeria/Bacterioides repeat